LYYHKLYLLQNIKWNPFSVIWIDIFFRRSKNRFEAVLQPLPLLKVTPPIAAIPIRPSWTAKLNHPLGEIQSTELGHSGRRSVSRNQLWKILPHLWPTKMSRKVTQVETELLSQHLQRNWSRSSFVGPKTNVMLWI